VNIFEKQVFLATFTLIFGIQMSLADMEQRYELGLREAVALSLSKNFAVRIGRIDPELAEERVRQRRGDFDPVLTLSGGVADEESLGLEGSGREEFANAFVDGILPWGSRYSVGLVRGDRDGAFLDRAAGANSGIALRVTQPLLRDFGPAFNRAGIRIAEKGWEQSRLGLRATIMETVANTIVSYNALRFAERNLEIAITNRDLANQLIEDNRRRLEVGSIAEADMRVAETRYALRKEIVLIAEQQLREQENVLKQLVSDSVEELLDLRVASVSSKEPKEMGIDLQADFAKAIKLRPDYQSALLGIDVDRLRVERDRRQRLPNLDLVGSLDYDARGGSIGGSISSLTDNAAESYSLQTVFSIPIPNRSSRSQYAISRLNLSRSEIELEQLKQLILLRLDDAARRVSTSWLRIEATREARVLAERSLEAEEKKLNLGVSRSFFVLELQGDLANAQVRETRAITDYYTALARYELERGTILETYNIATY